MSTNINFDKKLGISGGTAISLPSSTPSYQNEYSFSFDGIDDYVTMGNVLNMADDGTDAFSISCWFKTTSTATQIIIAKQTNASPYNGYNLYMSANRFKFSLGTLTASSYINGQTGLNGSITDGNWHHLCLTYDGSQDISGFNLYYDGVNTTIFTIANNTPASVSNTSDFNISGRGSGALVFNGNIDEASYFNLELSASDVTSIYNSGVPNNLNDLSTPPLSWWRMGEEATWDGIRDWNLVDQGTGGNDATSQNIADSERVTDVPPNPWTNTLSTSFDGVDDYVDCGNPASLQIIGVMTLSAWVKRDASATSSNYMIIGKDSIGGGTRSYILVYNPATTLTRFIIWKSGSASIVESTTDINDGQWHHVMGVNDGTDLKIYIDGVLENTNLGGGGTIDNGTSPFEIGRRASSPATRGFWNGLIDEVAVWNTDESANASAIGGTIPTDLSAYNPVSWWRCGDSDTSPILSDNGSGGNDGTMTNFTTFSTDVPT